MEKILDSIVRFLSVLAWPTVVLILLSVFKENLRNLIDRIRYLKYKDGLIGFGQESLDEHKPPTNPEIDKSEGAEAISPNLSLDKPATLFWLANDLMWSQDMLFRNAPSKKIIEGFKFIQEYVQDLGLEGFFADIELSRLIRDSEATLTNTSTEWSPEYRLALVQQIEDIKWFIANLAKEDEPGFKKHRVFR